jgi:hypothetical protein
LSFEENYFQVASRVLKGKNTLSSDSDKYDDSHQKHVSASAKRGKSPSDVWLAEYGYRSCSLRQREAWDNGSRELDALLSLAKETLAHRQVRLQELLVQFLTLKDQTLERGQRAQAEALTGLVAEEPPTEPTPSEMEVDFHSDPPTATVIAYFKKFYSSSAVLHSERLIHATVVKRREPQDCKARAPQGSSSRNQAESLFTISLAAVTTDGMLHLFDIPDVTCFYQLPSLEPQVVLGMLASGPAAGLSSPEYSCPASKGSLAPKNLFGRWSKKEEEKDEAVEVSLWRDRLVPTVTFNMNSCTVVSNAAKTVEIVRHRWTDNTTNRFVLHLATQPDRVAFSAALDGQTTRFWV